MLLYKYGNYCDDDTTEMMIVMTFFQRMDHISCLCVSFVREKRREGERGGEGGRGRETEGEGEGEGVGRGRVS